MSYGLTKETLDGWREPEGKVIRAIHQAAIYRTKGKCLRDGLGSPATLTAIAFGLIVLFTSTSAWSQDALSDIPEYRDFPVVGSRVAVWVVAQLHLMFAAFILGVPMFAVIIEYVGVRSGDPRYDRMAKEFIKLCLVAFSTTALFGAVLVFLMIGFYPRFFGYLSNIFAPT